MHICPKHHTSLNMFQSAFSPSPGLNQPHLPITNLQAEPTTHLSLQHQRPSHSNIFFILHDQKAHITNVTVGRNWERKAFAYRNTQPKVTLSHVYWFLCLYFNLSMTQVNFALLKSQRVNSCLWIVKAAAVNNRQKGTTCTGSDRASQHTQAEHLLRVRVRVSIISIVALAMATRCA